jgi:hypothetical protein
MANSEPTDFGTTAATENLSLTGGVLGRMSRMASGYENEWSAGLARIRVQSE